MPNIATIPIIRARHRGPWDSIYDIRAANRAAGQHWFDPDTLRFFASRVGETIYGGRYFLSSEKSGFDDPTRVWSVREATPDARIETVGGEDAKHATRASAERIAHRLAATGGSAYLRDLIVRYVLTARPLADDPGRRDPMTAAEIAKSARNWRGLRRGGWPRVADVHAELQRLVIDGRVAECVTLPDGAALRWQLSSGEGR